MAIELIVELGKHYTWESFQRLTSLGSLALDGIVIARTQFTDTHGVIDHHLLEPADSTCKQALDLIKKGILSSFKFALFDHGDEDVDTTYTALNNPSLCDDPNFEQLVSVENSLDINAGMYPIGDPDLRESIAWIYEPYHIVRFNGTLPQLKADGLKTIIYETESRILAYVKGNGKRRSLVGQYDILGYAAGYVIVDENGPDARMAMCSAGIKAFISFVGRTNGCFRYSFYRSPDCDDSVLLPSQLCSKLNLIESLPFDKGWGFGGRRGGSAKMYGSKLSPEQLKQALS